MKTKRVKKVKRWLIMNEWDANDSFLVEAPTQEGAMLVALSELGWSISAKPVDVLPVDDDE